ncbi:MAG: calcineurin-like phosphoesterase C-terminal domain-containing protein, partial [Planctomycetota bacterium]
QGEQSGQQYDGHFNDDALAFLQSYMRHVPKHELLVVAFHIPLFDVDNLDEFLQILGRHPHTLSLSAHWHVQRHVYYAGEDGWSGVSSTANNHLHHKPGDEMRHHSHDIHPHDHSLHHHLCHATACGSWWRGAPGGDGIPHALMRDGTPQGFSILTVEPDGAYEIDYKASGRPTEAQLHIWMPEPLTAAAIARQEAEVVVNVWAGSPRDRVEMRVLRTAPGRRPHVTGWVELAHDVRPDPYYLEAKALEDAIKAKLPEGESLAWREMPSPVDAHHIWSAPVPVGLSEGAYVLLVRWTDQWGREHESRRVLRIEP